MTRTGNILKGTRYPDWVAEIDGDDILIRGNHATWFGGNDDPLDDGTTSSGISTKSNPNYLGCALPIDYAVGKLAIKNPKHNPCHDSPLPCLPWGTNVEFTNRDNGEVHIGKLIDDGPSAPPVAHAAIDLTKPLFVLLGGNLGKGVINVDARIIGGAKLAGLSPAPDTTPEAAQTESPQSPPDPNSGITITPNFGPRMGI